MSNDYETTINFQKFSNFFEEINKVWDISNLGNDYVFKFANKIPIDVESVLDNNNDLNVNATGLDLIDDSFFTVEDFRLGKSTTEGLQVYFDRPSSQDCYKNTENNKFYNNYNPNTGEFSNEVTPVNNHYYHDLLTDDYYKYTNEYVLQDGLLHIGINNSKLGERGYYYNNNFYPNWNGTSGQGTIYDKVNGKYYIDHKFPAHDIYSCNGSSYSLVKCIGYYNVNDGLFYKTHKSVGDFSDVITGDTSVYYFDIITQSYYEYNGTTFVSSTDSPDLDYLSDNGELIVKGLFLCKPHNNKLFPIVYCRFSNSLLVKSSIDIPFYSELINIGECDK